MWAAGNQIFFYFRLHGLVRVLALHFGIQHVLDKVPNQCALTSRFPDSKPFELLYALFL